MGKLSNKVAIITGATAGIGRATALLFADEGADMVITGRRTGLGERVVEAILQKGRRGLFVQADHRCLPVRGHEGEVACQEGLACTTEYGVGRATECVVGEGGSDTHCFETCAQGTGPCGGDGAHRCMPLAREDGGVCAYFGA